MTRAALRAQMLAALKAAPWPPRAATAAAVLAVLQPLLAAALAARILGTEATTLRSWIGEWQTAP